MALARPRLVILRALGLGDLLTAVPALRAIAHAFAEHERILAAPPTLWPLVRLIDVDGRPAIDRLAAVGELEPLPAWLAGAEVAVNLHGRGPQSHGIVHAIRPRRALWFEHPSIPDSLGSPRWRADEHEVARWCRLLAESGLSADPTRLLLRRPPAPPAWALGATLIHPGAASAARRWPAERFAAVARAERLRGARVVITGSAAERPLAQRVARLAELPDRCVHAGDADLGELAAAVAGAAKVLCGDTGVGHLATALGTPSVLLFGPTPPARWGPPAGSQRHRVLWSGRHGDPHAQRPDPGLLEITAADVVQALDTVALRGADAVPST